MRQRRQNPRQRQRFHLGTGRSDPRQRQRFLLGTGRADPRQRQRFLLGTGRSAAGLSAMSPRLQRLPHARCCRLLLETLPESK
eukprot:8894568-Pyramimonas_sp.AAC.1